MYTGEFIVDGLTESLTEVKTGVSRKTFILPVSKKIPRQICKKNGWRFNWREQLDNSDSQVYSLFVEGGDKRVQGIISATPEQHNKWIHMNLIESAPHNRGLNKEYIGVPANLVAYICKLSFEKGFDGYAHFIAKTNLIEHYKKILGAASMRINNHMVIVTESAEKLVNLYFKNNKHD